MHIIVTLAKRIYRRAAKRFLQFVGKPDHQETHDDRHGRKYADNDRDMLTGSHYFTYAM